jgi:hypothetical protein
MLEDQVVKSLQINYFVTSQNNQMNYARLLNHKKLGMIWKCYPSLVYFKHEKVLRFCHIFFFLFIPN